MESNVLLSIIVPIYNSALFLKRCVESVYAQDLDCDHFELLLIDDGSTDDSLKVCKDLRSRHNNIKVFAKENGGQATARNLGLEHAQGKYVMFLDSDDSLEADSLPQLLVTAEESHADVLLSTMKMYNQYGNTTIQSDYQNYNHVVSGEYALMGGLNLGSCCARLYLRDLLCHHEIRFRQGVHHEDVIFSIDVMTVAKRVISVRQCSYIYFWNEGSTDRSKGEEAIRKSLQGDLAVIKKLKEKADCDALNASLRHDLSKRGNSLLVSNLIFLMRNNLKDLKRHYIRHAVSERLLPMRGKANSWKSTLALRVLNVLLLLSGDLRGGHAEIPKK